MLSLAISADRYLDNGPVIYDCAPQLPTRQRRHDHNLAVRRLWRWWHHTAGFDGDFLCSRANSNTNPHANSDTIAYANNFTNTNSITYRHAQSDAAATSDSTPSPDTVVVSWNPYAGTRERNSRVPAVAGRNRGRTGGDRSESATLARVSDARRQSRKYFANALRTTRSTFVADRISKKAGCARACDSPEGDVCAKRNFPVLRVVD